jgi:hypothetical protein
MIFSRVAFFGGVLLGSLLVLALHRYCMNRREARKTKEEVVQTEQLEPSPSSANPKE